MDNQQSLLYSTWKKRVLNIKKKWKHNYHILKDCFKTGKIDKEN